MEYTDIGPIRIYAVDDHLRSGPFASPVTQWMILAQVPKGRLAYVVIPFTQVKQCHAPWTAFDNALTTLAYCIETGETF